MPGALAHDETVSADVEGAGELGVAQRGHVAESGLGDLDHHRFGAAGDRDGATSRRDQARGVANGVGAGRTGRGHRLARSAESESHRHRGGGGVGHHHRHHEGRDAVGSFFIEDAELLHDGLESTDAGGDDAAGIDDRSGRGRSGATLRPRP